MIRLLAVLAAVILGAPLVSAESAPRRPNILLAIADDWGHGHAGILGCTWVSTPAFDRVAREGLLFRSAYTPNAKCAPSRSCLLTGRNPWQLGAAANHVPEFPSGFRVWSEVLMESGWFVGHTGKGWGPGVARDASGGPRSLLGRTFNARRLAPPTTGIAPNDYAANFRDFLEAAPTNHPWCFWYGSLEPHRAYQFGSGSRVDDPATRPPDRVPAVWPDIPEVRQDLLDYAREVGHFDRHLGTMLEELDRRGLLETTVVIVTSDHGPPFPRMKGQAYDASNHIPLAIRCPGGIPVPGRAVDDLVSLIDLAPTVLEMAGLDPTRSGMAAMTGRSLLPLLRENGRDRPPFREHLLVGKERHDVGRPGDAGYPIRGIHHDGWLYLRNHAPDRWPAGNPETGYLNCDGGETKSRILERHRRDPSDPHWALCFGRRPAEELYHVAVDPDCVRNLAADPDQAVRRESLRKRMEDALRAENDPRMEGRGDEFDAFPYADPSTRDFHGRFLRGERPRAGWVNPGDFEPRAIE